MSEPLKKGDLCIVVGGPSHSSPRHNDWVGRIVELIDDGCVDAGYRYFTVRFVGPLPESATPGYVHQVATNRLRKIAGPSVDVTTRHEETIDA